jgi:WD40 repeat protein
MIIATSGSFDNTIKLWDILTTKDSITLIAKLENR